MVVLDATGAWLQVVMINTGAITSNGRGPLGVLVVQVLVLVVTAVSITQFYYGLDDNESRVFGGVVAVGNWIVNLILIGIMAVGVSALLTGGRNRAPSGDGRSLGGCGPLIQPADGKRCRPSHHAPPEPEHVDHHRRPAVERIDFFRTQ